jgi:hypothetical protein
MKLVLSNVAIPPLEVSQHPVNPSTFSLIVLDKVPTLFDVPCYASGPDTLPSRIFATVWSV